MSSSKDVTGASATLARLSAIAATAVRGTWITEAHLGHCRLPETNLLPDIPLPLDKPDLALPQLGLARGALGLVSAYCR